jgi:outer membrane immunogenic protein
MKSVYVSAVRVPLAIAFVSVAFSAQAADLYDHGGGAKDYKDAPYYDAVPNWTGFYLGINGGYGWAGQSSRLNASAIDDTLTAASASSKLWPEGGFGGGQLGYNVQRDRLVFGVEADIEGAGISGRTGTEAVSVSGGAFTDAWAKSTLDWFGTLRGRAGYAAGGTLLYATGGFAYGGVRDRLNQAVTSSNAGATAYDSASSTTTATGYVVGGGFETAITPSWSFKAEYQYIDLGSTLLSTATANGDLPYTCQAGTCSDNGSASTKFHHIYNTVRIGLNYKVNQPYEPLK